MLQIRQYIAIVEAMNPPVPAPSSAQPILAPAHIRTRYLRGGCYALALALHKATKLPLCGLYEAGTDDLHHAFVRDPATGMALDIRGLLPLDQEAEGSAVEVPDYRPIRRADIIGVVGSIAAADMKQANEVVRTYFRRWLR